MNRGWVKGYFSLAPAIDVSLEQYSIAGETAGVRGPAQQSLSSTKDQGPVPLTPALSPIPEFSVSQVARGEREKASDSLMSELTPKGAGSLATSATVRGRTFETDGTIIWSRVRTHSTSINHEPRLSLVVAGSVIAPAGGAC